MAHLASFLEEVGMSPTEAVVYLTGLESPSDTIAEIAKQTGIKRTTVHNAYTSLVEKGFATKIAVGGRLHFRLLPPETIEKRIKKDIGVMHERLGRFEKLLPQFKKSGRDASHTIVASQYDGVQGVRAVVDEALYCSDRKWDIIAPSKNFFSEFDTAYAEYFIKTRAARGITARSLWERTTSRRLLTPDEMKMRNPRILPKSMQGKFSSVIILFDTKVALISSFKEKGAVLIESKDVHATFKAIFEGLWSVSDSYQ